MSILFRSTFLALLFLSGTIIHACTLFKITKDGKTIVGNNEDALSINPKIRFVNGKNGDHGAVYFAHFNGHPLLQMADQGGMNTAGLMYDALVIEPKTVAPDPSKKRVDLQTLMHLIMQTCTTVREAKTLLEAYDRAMLTKSMLVLVDRTGEYLVVESDTMIIGNEPSYAFANFRVSACSNVDAVPIERFQRGRAMLAARADTTLNYVKDVLSTMTVCRKKLGNGTLYSNLFDLQTGTLDLYFYHDLNTVRTFDLRTELAKGDHELVMESLFPTNAEFELLKNYKNPSHQHWLFYILVVTGCSMGFMALFFMILMLRDLFRSPRNMKQIGTYLLFILACGIFCSILPFLLFFDTVFYFGLGSFTDAISPAIAYLPLLLCLLLPVLVFVVLRTRKIGSNGLVRSAFLATTIVCALAVSMFFYWDMLMI